MHEYVIVWALLLCVIQYMIALGKCTSKEWKKCTHINLATTVNDIIDN